MACRISVISQGVSTSLTFSISAWTWSIPGASSFLRRLMAWFTFSTVGTSVSMLRMSTPSRISANVVGHSWLSTLSKWFYQQISSFVLEANFPFCFCTSVSVLCTLHSKFLWCGIRFPCLVLRQVVTLNMHKWPNLKSGHTYRSGHIKLLFRYLFWFTNIMERVSWFYFLF